MQRAHMPHTYHTHTPQQTCCIHLWCYTHTPEHQSLHADTHNIHMPHTHTHCMHILHSTQATYTPKSIHTKHTTCTTDTTNTFVHMHVPHTLLKTSSFHRKLRLHAHQLKEGQSSSNRNKRLEHSHPLLWCYVFSSSFFVPEQNFCGSGKVTLK